MASPSLHEHTEKQCNQAQLYSLAQETTSNLLPQETMSKLACPSSLSIFVEFAVT